MYLDLFLFFVSFVFKLRTDSKIVFFSDKLKLLAEKTHVAPDSGEEKNGSNFFLFFRILPELVQSGLTHILQH